MATTTPGITFVSGETVTPAKLNSAATPTISAIQTADISDNQITTAKIVDANVTDAKLATGAVTGAAGGGKLAASAITGQTAIDALASGDTLLIHDDSNTALRKVTWSQIVAAIQPAGSVLQTVVSTENISSNLTSATPADSGIAAVSLTRKSTTSKLILSLAGGRYFSNGDTLRTYFYTQNNGTGSYSNVVSTGTGAVEYLTLNSANGYFAHSAQFSYTPSSAVSSVSLKIYYDVTAGGQWHVADSEPFTITISEIKA